VRGTTAAWPVWYVLELMFERGDCRDDMRIFVAVEFFNFVSLEALTRGVMDVLRMPPGSPAMSYKHSCQTCIPWPTSMVLWLVSSAAYCLHMASLQLALHWMAL